MYSVTKIQSGLIYADSFTSLGGWTNDGTWTSVQNPAFISWGMLQESPITHGSTFDRDGVREPNPFIDDDGTYYMLCDGGDGTTGWTSFIERSYDKGKTWEKLGQMPPGYANGSGGSIKVNAMGFLTKFEGKYCYYRVTGLKTFEEAIPGSPNVGLPAPPYTGDMWESTSILSGWVYKGSLTKVPGTWTASEHLPCSVFKSGSTYYLCSEGSSGIAPGYYQIGLSSGPTPFGPWTQMNPSIYAPTTYAHGAENTKIFYHPQIDKWIVLSNLIAADETVTDQNSIHISSSPTDLSGASLRILHRICPMDGAHAVGVLAPINIPDGTYILPNGDVPIYYDSNPERFAGAGWHLGRKLEGSIMELYTHALRFEASATSVARSITKTVAHTNFVAEFGVQFANNSTGTNVTFTYRATGGNSYKLTVRNSQWLLLQRITGGIATTLFSATSGISTSNMWISRIKLSVQGDSHKAYVDGELQINVTDSTYAGGDFIGFGGLNAISAEIRAFSMRLSDTVTVQGTVKNKRVFLKNSVGMPLTSGVAGASSVSIAANHYPADLLDYGGSEYGGVDKIWGGDILSISTNVSASLTDNKAVTGNTISVLLNPINQNTSGTAVRKYLAE